MKKIHQANLDETFICSKVGFSGRLLQVNIDSVILPNGRETTRELIHTSGSSPGSGFPAGISYITVPTG